jgi:hypothetical protein
MRPVIVHSPHAYSIGTSLCILPDKVHHTISWALGVHSGRTHPPHQPVSSSPSLPRQGSVWPSFQGQALGTAATPIASRFTWSSCPEHGLWLPQRSPTSTAWILIPGVNSDQCGRDRKKLTRKSMRILILHELSAWASEDTLHAFLYESEVGMIMLSLICFPFFPPLTHLSPYSWCLGLYFSR